MTFVASKKENTSPSMVSSLPNLSSLHHFPPLSCNTVVALGARNKSSIRSSSPSKPKQMKCSASNVKGKQEKNPDGCKHVVALGASSKSDSGVISSSNAVVALGACSKSGIGFISPSKPKQMVCSAAYVKGKQENIHDGCKHVIEDSETSDSNDMSSEEQSDEEDLFFEVKAQTSDLEQAVCEADDIKKRCSELRKYMRQRPCLPPKADGTELTSEDLNTGTQLPLYACPFQGCRYASNNRAHFLHHVAGGVTDATHKACIENVCGVDLPWMTRLDYVHGAVAIAERERWPLLGLSTTRRALNHVCERYNDSTVGCAACFICGQIRTTCTGYAHIDLDEQNPKKWRQTSSEFDWKTIGWFADLESKAPGTLLNNCSLELWRRRYSSSTANVSTDDTASQPWTYTGLIDGKYSCCEATQRERHISKWAACLPMHNHALMLFGCTEDIRCTEELTHKSDIETEPFVRRLCPQCNIPLCSACAHSLHKHDNASKYNDGGTIPMSLCNDHYYGHVNRFIVDEKVTWLECAASCMVWSTILVFYLELPYGHLMNEVMGSPSARTQVKGNLFSFTMPWEDIERCCYLACVHASEPHQEALNELRSELSLPHSEDTLATLVFQAVRELGRYVFFDRSVCLKIRSCMLYVVRFPELA